MGGLVQDCILDPDLPDVMKKPRELRHLEEIAVAFEVCLPLLGDLGGSPERIIGNPLAMALGIPVPRLNRGDKRARRLNEELMLLLVGEG